MSELDKTVVVERIKLVNEAPTWVPESVSPTVEVDFAIDEARLEYEMCRLGHLLASYGNLAAELKAELIRKEEQLKRAYAISAQAIRAEHQGSGVKITDPAVKEKVEVGERYGNQQAGLQMVRLYAIMAEAWFQSIKKKADLVIALAYKQGREIKAYEQGG
jgi:hypothetical protein